MNIQGFQKLTLLDFPGKMACTVFTGGCNLRCPFCHNGDLVRHPLLHSNATGDVLAYLEGRRSLLDGVCITGGEPLLQTDLTAFVRQVKAMGYLVKLDTNGTLPDRLEALLATGLLDYVAMDVKNGLSGYDIACGGEVDTDAILRSMTLLKESGVDHEFRTTLVKGVHTPDLIREAAALVGDSPYFLQQFVDSGNLLAGGEAFSPEEVFALLAAVREVAPHTALRGLAEE